jgi:hypothetical protein
MSPLPQLDRFIYTKYRGQFVFSIYRTNLTMHDERLFDNWHWKMSQIQVLKTVRLMIFIYFFFKDESSDDNDLQLLVKPTLQRKI